MIRRRADELGALADVLLVELAGGLFTPLDDTSTNAELVEGLLPARLLLVAPDRLGVLHDVGACVRAARASGLVVDALVLSAPSQPDATTGSNAGELERLGLGPIGAVFPRASRDDPRSLTAAVQAWTGLQVRGA
jgi:dethiobiotin synthetase